MARAVNQATIDLVRTFEGLRLKAYLCPAGVWTIGVGHSHDVHEGDWLTAEEAHEYLAHDLNDAGSEVEHLIKVPLNENQYGALCSFVFNLGPTALERSTLRGLLNGGDYDSVPTQLMRWTKATDPGTGARETLPGLVRRRMAEIKLWNTEV